ncbi:SAM-dependent methyltransferase [Lentzea sp. DG1S-22]|uniref:SAM-dependent methyltransferase n=1 Tax=Lentzea sp. DG1S-22 TaxID=3108822 RepID=UPI002E775BCC|nr:SAM-dependent methyltransferase [Lentzea sp. DG1S-22]WVH82165.1 SAM-dependent methyltransferase [Lentzea sp. DG1S-22]
MPDVRVVYVDYEPVVVAHSQLLLAHNDNADIVEAGTTHPEDVFGAEPTRRLLDFDQPVEPLACSPAIRGEQAVNTVKSSVPKAREPGTHT